MSALLKLLWGLLGKQVPINAKGLGTPLAGHSPPGKGNAPWQLEGLI